MEFLTEKKISLRNVPGGGGGILGCLGRPTPPPGGRAGSENRYTSSYDHDM